jgi:hypothetical protein
MSLNLASDEFEIDRPRMWFDVAYGCLEFEFYEYLVDDKIYNRIFLALRVNL